MKLVWIEYLWFTLKSQRLKWLTNLYSFDHSLNIRNESFSGPHSLQQLQQGKHLENCVWFNSKLIINTAGITISEGLNSAQL